MSEKLSEEELAEFRELFQMVDSDGGGTIDRVELKRLLDTIGVYPTTAEVNVIFREVDSNDSGDIAFDEFARFMSGGQLTGFDAEEVRQSFEALRTPGTPAGFVRVEDLRAAFTTHVPDKYQAEGLVDDLFSHLRGDKRGLINFDEYVTTVLRPVNGGGGASKTK